VAGLSAAEAAALGEAFVELGVLFQLQDDVLDLYGDKGRGAPATGGR
jgi:geranylgeranyl pyrophosphate synthase